MEKFYNEKNTKVEKLIKELNMQKENEINSLKGCTEKVVNELKNENKSLQKDLNKMKKELASNIVDGKKKDDIIENYRRELETSNEVNEKNEQRFKELSKLNGQLDKTVKKMNFTDLDSLKIKTVEQDVLTNLNIQNKKTWCKIAGEKSISVEIQTDDKSDMKSNKINHSGLNQNENNKGN